MKLFKAKVLVWPLILVAALVIAAGTFVAMNVSAMMSVFGTSSSGTRTELIQSRTPQEQVVLLSLGIQGIDEKRQKGVIFGVEVPGSERATFVKYGFDAKLGIDGENVEITETGEGTYLISIPELIFIGHDNPEFEIAAENNGALSWVTAEIDPVEMINNILNDEVKLEYIDKNREIIQRQAETFYSGIILSVAPDVALTFEFRD
ncbi:MAG TPA: hypothetical protein PKW13_04830 [Rhodoglobus sp.]|nr:hypothetical protein [Rhodoglobus sp.]